MLPHQWGLVKLQTQLDKEIITTIYENRTVCKDAYGKYTSVTPKILKN
jgi:hypothetical protein